MLMVTRRIAPRHPWNLVRRAHLRLIAKLVSVVFVAGGIASAQGQEDLLSLEEQAFRAAVAKASASVVQIETFGGMERIDSELVADGPTTGTIISADGWILSSLYSFRQQPASILVSLPDGKRASARLVARDLSREIALLKIDVENPLTAIEISNMPISNSAVGKWCLALGKTFDRDVVSRSLGIISAVGRSYGKAVQTDAKVSPVNYGGPLIDLEGRAIGILAPLSPGSFMEGDSSELYDSGIGFAIPLDSINQRLAVMQQGQDIHSGKLGIVTRDQNEMGGPVRVVGAIPGSPAARGGLRAGDIIMEADGRPVRILADLRHALGLRDAGQEISMTIMRRGERIENLTCELAQSIPVYRKRYLGISVVNLADQADANPQEQPEDPDNNSQEEETQSGLRVVAVAADSPAQQAGINVGDVILAYDGTALASARDLRENLAIAELDRAIQLTLQTADVSKEVTVTPVTWPNELQSELPATWADEDQRGDPQIVEIALGDFTNTAFAVVPDNPNLRPLGLAIVFPEPGEVDQEKTKLAWAEFCNLHGWIIAVINSADDQRWTQDEIAIAERVLGRINNGYPLDRGRTVVAGLGIGGRLAIIAANTLRDRVSGVLTIGTGLQRFQVRSNNEPLQSLDYLLVGETDPLNQAAEGLRERGFGAITLAAPGLEAQRWETHPLDQIQIWMQGLGRL